MARIAGTFEEIIARATTLPGEPLPQGEKDVKLEKMAAAGFGDGVSPKNASHVEVSPTSPWRGLRARKGTGELLYGDETFEEAELEMYEGQVPP